VSVKWAKVELLSVFFKQETEIIEWQILHDLGHDTIVDSLVKLLQL
jgi:hypothetical protein